MQSTRPVKEGWKQEYGDQGLPFFSRVHIIHHPVDRDGAEHGDK